MTGAHPTAARAPLFGSTTRGILWFTACGACYVLAWTIVRDIAQQLPVFEIAFLRALYGLVFMAPWLRKHGIRALKTRRIGLYAVRSTLAMASLMCVIGALVYLPVADVTALGFTRPIFASLCAILVLREAASGARWTATIVGFIGAMIIIRPGFADLNIGVLLAIGSALLTAISFSVIKSLARTENPDAIAMYMVLFSVPLSGVPALFVWVNPSWEQLGWMAAVGLLTTLAQRAIGRAYAAADVTVVQPFDFLRLPMAALIGFLVFAELPDVYVWLGGAVIFAAGLYITVIEAYGRRGEAAGP